MSWRQEILLKDAQIKKDGVEFQRKGREKRAGKGKAVELKRGSSTDCYQNRQPEKHRKTCLNLSRIWSDSVIKSIWNTGNVYP